MTKIDQQIVDLTGGEYSVTGYNLLAAAQAYEGMPKSTVKLGNQREDWWDEWLMNLVVVRTRASGA